MKRNHYSLRLAIGLTGVLAWSSTLALAAKKGPKPSFYHTTTTWHASMLESRQVLTRLEEQGKRTRGLDPHVVEIVRSGEPARHISLPIAGAKELYLIATGAPEIVFGAADWAACQLVARDGSTTRACHIKGLQFFWGRHNTDRNLHSGVNERMKIAAREFEHGFELYANCAVRIPLDKDYERFEAWIGVDDWVKGPGTVRFIIGGPGTFAREELWHRLKLDFAEGVPRRQMKWEHEDRILEKDWALGEFGELAARYAAACFRVPDLQAQAKTLAGTVRDAESLRRVRTLYYRSRQLDAVLARAAKLNCSGLRLAINNLHQSFDQRYPKGNDYAQRLQQVEQDVQSLLPWCQTRGLADLERLDSLVRAFDQLQSEALLANPLLDFDRLLLVKRRPDGDPRRTHGDYAKGYSLGEYLGLPRQSSKCNPNIERPIGWDNEIAVLSMAQRDGALTTFFRPSDDELVEDLDLNFDADKMAFSMPDPNGRWRVWQLDRNGRNLTRLPQAPYSQIDYYDPCYLPDGQIVFCSTASMQGVPCNAGVIVGMLYRMDPDGSNVQQLCFEQDHDYCPSVLNDGRVLYMRWDYTDTPHVWNRMLFAMNPDGSGQAEVYGNNSYWPNAIFYARAIPNHPTQIVGVVTGHHMGRVGELILFDPARGKKETAGVVQRIPDRGQTVEPLIEDKLTEHSWPKFLHPYPLNDKYFIVSCKPTPDSLWGIYLVDVFDNMTLIREEEGYALMEPIPFRARQRPPIIRDQMRLKTDGAFVQVMDVHAGPGMKDVPKGTVKKLRVFTYHFTYQHMAGIRDRIGTDGPWEVKHVLGTVPVQPDGSAFFRIPAKTPISVQPLDANGRALALMRSWMTAMPGETLTCVGCHEQERNTSPPNVATLAMRHGLADITPWDGPPRNFDFQREVQPVLDKFCVGCHNGQTKQDGQLVLPDLRRSQGFLYAYKHGNPKLLKFPSSEKKELIGKYRGLFEPSYIELRRYVRVGGLESDLHLLDPMEFHTSTDELVQMLEKSHYNVKLDEDAWSRLVTWIDLNAPCHGTWSEFAPIPGPADQRTLRVELRQKYSGGIPEDWDTASAMPMSEPIKPIKPILPEPLPPRKTRSVTCDGWPFDAEKAVKRQNAAGPATNQTVRLADGTTIEFIRIPAGQFILGSSSGDSDEWPLTVVKIEKPFWMSCYEVTNAQYARFDPNHDSRFEHRTSWIFGEKYLGWPLNRPNQPVVRVSWNESMEFCTWLSATLRTTVTLPTEAQWEYACRAGSATPLSFGDLNSDFAAWANMADQSMRDLAYEGWGPQVPDIVVRDDRFNDGQFVSTEVGSYQPNPWGLYDMHGNVAEWTRSVYRPYPYRADDGRNAMDSQARRVVRGGSWYDRPKRCRSAFRLAYAPYQKVYNVGFRIVCETLPGDRKLAQRER